MDVVEKRRPRTAASRPAQGRRRGGAAPLDHADGVRREAGDAHLRPRGPGSRTSADLGFDAGGRASAGRHGQAAARDHPGHRPHRFGQDHHALLHAAQAGHRRGERLHGRGPDRDGRACVQPDAGAGRSSTSASPTGVRTLMRQDPDIIMVGEIRDLETAEIAVQAALTGHLVLSTLHTNDAPTSVTRLLDLGMPELPRQRHVDRHRRAAAGAHAVPALQAAHAPGPDPVESLINPWPLPAPETICAPKGCLECRNSGYHGRIGLYEMLTLDTEIRSLISAEFEEGPLRALAYGKGMRPLRIGGAMKVAEGLTSLEEVFKVAPIRVD